ncbi:uncharacterized protein LOC142564798 [Dermacentor variabilis]|uniref:uncharacterized protein LOC142564798 n=1 Tax=Dermacentor variabilis TaxID=34621 RepID=UPI003F5C5E82
MTGRHVHTTTLLGFILGACVVNSGSSCNTQLPRIGPRLLQAKALFGEIFRVCKEDLVAYAKTIPSDKLRFVMQMTCAQYNICKALIRTEAQQSYDCMLEQVHNESSLHYTRLNLTKEHMHAADKAVACAWNIVGNSTAYIQALDDTTALIRHAALTFGWT